MAKKFERDVGIKVTIETPQGITSSFPIAAQAGQGPLALETVTLIYNKQLLEGSPPTDLSQLVAINQSLHARHPGVRTILWDYDSAYYSWGILASADGFVFGRTGQDYDVQKVGVATPGAVEALTRIIGLVRAGILPSYIRYSTVEDLMGQGKVAMIVSGPWAWSNLTAGGINFGLALMPGVGGKPAQPFVGVSVAYINRASPNVNLIPYFIENYLATAEGFTSMDQVEPIGVPALTSLYRAMAKDHPLIQQLKNAVDHGQLMPNVPQMDGFFSSVSTALHLATQGRASAQQALQDAAASMQAQ